MKSIFLSQNSCRYHRGTDCSYYKKTQLFSANSFVMITTQTHYFGGCKGPMKNQMITVKVERSQVSSLWADRSERVIQKGRNCQVVKKVMTTNILKRLNSYGKKSLSCPVLLLEICYTKLFRPAVAA